MFLLYLAVDPRTREENECMDEQTKNQIRKRNVQHKMFYQSQVAVISELTLTQHVPT